MNSSVDIPVVPCSPCSQGNGEELHSPARLVERGTAKQLVHNTKLKLLSGNFDVLVIEMCCERESEIGCNVPVRALSLRITKDLDLTSKKTKAALHTIIDFAAQVHVPVHIWVSIECTAG